MHDYKYMVRVSCMTYNHAAFIEDAMNGFCMQETKFPFICTIVDDASTDGETEVIKRYLDAHFDIADGAVVREEESEDYRLIFARHLTNKNCFFAVLFLKYNHYSKRKSKKHYIEEWAEDSKYTALCEGDDFWIRSDKLQKQVDFMEAHPRHTMCIHAYRRNSYAEDSVLWLDIHKYSGDVEIIPDSDVINGTGMFGATASVLYRNSAVSDYPAWAKNAPVGDRPLKFVLFARGSIAYLNEVMSVYRVGVPGSWTMRVLRKRKVEKKTREKFVQLLADFDEWTSWKYHSLVKQAIKDYKHSCRWQDIVRFFYRPYSLVKNTLVGRAIKSIFR